MELCEKLHVKSWLIWSIGESLEFSNECLLTELVILAVASFIWQITVKWSENPVVSGVLMYLAEFIGTWELCVMEVFEVLSVFGV